MSERRDVFLGAFITRSLRNALDKEANRRGASLSLIVQSALSKHFKLKNGHHGNRRGQGRKIDPRVKLTETFRTAILGSRLTREELAKMAGFNRAQSLSTLLRGDEIIMSSKTKSHVERLVTALRYQGEVYL